MTKLPGITTQEKLTTAYKLIEHSENEVTRTSHTCSEILDEDPTEAQILDYLSRIEDSSEYQSLEESTPPESDRKENHEMKLREIRQELTYEENKVFYTFQFNGKNSKLTVQGKIEQDTKDYPPSLS